MEYTFIRKLQNKGSLTIPLAEINLLISRRDEIPYRNLTNDEFEKILGDVFFDFVGFTDGVNLSPEKRLKLFMTKIESLTIKNDYFRLCQENRVYEIAMLLDRDSSTEILVKKRE